MRSSKSTGSISSRRVDLWFLATLAAITVAALALRLYRLGFESLDMDELVQVRGYSRSPYGIVSWAADMGQPVLDYIIGATMYRAGLTGTDAAVRVPAVLFGAGSVLLVGLWARRIAGRSVGLASALLLAVCPFHVILSQQARQYTIFVFFALATLMAFDRARRSRTPRAWTMFSATFFALLMTRWVGPHVLGIGIVGYTLATWAVAYRRDDVASIYEEKRSLYATATAMAIPYLLSLPMLIMLVTRSRGGISPGFDGFVVRAADHLVDGLFATLAGFSARTLFDAHFPGGWFLATATILSLLGLVSLVRSAVGHHNRRAAIFMASMGSFPILYAIVFACFTGALAKPQYLLLMAVPVLLSVAVAAKAIRDAVATRSRLAGKFAFGVIVAGIGLPMYAASLDCLEKKDKRDWRAAMTYLRFHASGSDAFAVTASDRVPSVFAPLAFGKFRYGIPQAKFLPIRQTTDAVELATGEWSKPADTTWLLVYTDRMYLGYDQVPAPAASPPLIRVHRFHGLFLIESRASETAADQLMDAIATLYRDLPPARSLVAPALLRAQFLRAKGDESAANESLDLAFRQCGDAAEAEVLRVALEADPRSRVLLTARTKASRSANALSRE